MTQSLSESYKEEKNLLLLPGIEPRFFFHPAHIPVVIPTDLAWFLGSIKGEEFIDEQGGWHSGNPLEIYSRGSRLKSRSGRRLS
jgi:hypothetical protein